MTVMELLELAPTGIEVRKQRKGWRAQLCGPKTDYIYVAAKAPKLNDAIAKLLKKLDLR